MVTIYDAAAKDYPAVATLLTQTRQQPIGSNQLERLATRGFVVWRPRLAVLDNGRLAGASFLTQSKSDGGGRYNLHIDVEPSWQRRGIGSALYEDALTFAQGAGLASFYAYVFENRTGGVAFAQKKGFAITRQAIHSRLDVASFDERPFQHHLANNEANHVRFTNLAAVGDTLENRRLLYELNKVCSADIPGRGPFFTFEEYCTVRFKNPAYRPEGVVLALDGEKWVGLSAATYHSQGNFVFNEMTGVIRPYRKRGIALALKLLTIRFAAEVGAEYIRTFNDFKNQAMLGVNQQMGYEQLPSSFTMERPFELKS